MLDAVFRTTRTRLYRCYRRDARFTNRQLGLKKLHIWAQIPRATFPAVCIHTSCNPTLLKPDNISRKREFPGGLTIILRTEGDRPGFISNRATANGPVATTSTQVLLFRGMSSCKCPTGKPILTPGGYALVQPQLTLVHVTVSHPPTAMLMDCVNP